MLRFILKHKWKDVTNGAESEGLFTIDAEVQELEDLLKSGGFSENGYEFNELVGVEVLKEENKEKI